VAHEVYRGAVSVMMRVVFLLFAEDGGCSRRTTSCTPGRTQLSADLAVGAALAHAGRGCRRRMAVSVRLLEYPSACSALSNSVTSALPRLLRGDHR
jgi:hypothetical protein